MRREGNGCAERVIRTLKEQLLWVKTFATVEELRLAVIAWAELYNREWLIERHGFKSPLRSTPSVLREHRRETRGVTNRVTINPLSRKSLTATYADAPIPQLAGQLGCSI